MRTPLPHQQEAIDRLVSMGGRGLLCDEMGLGKSSVALWVMQRLGCKNITVVCPLSVTHKWCDEVTTTLDRGVTIVQRKKDSWVRYADTHVVHYEGLVALPQEKLDLLNTDGLIIDECHYAKTRTSLRSRAVRALAQRCRHVLCLTGTLVRNDVRDVWHPTELAVPGHLGTYAMFEARYCDFRQFKLPSMRRPVKQFTSSKNEAQLAAKLNEVMVRRKKIDVVDLPPKQRVVVPLDLDKESARAYREMKQRAMVELGQLVITEGVEQMWMGGSSFEDGPITRKLSDDEHRTVVARTALEQAIRLEQITSGVIGGACARHSQHGKAEETIVLAESAKIAWTLETIADLRAQGRSVAVFCKFNATGALLEDALPAYSVHVITGNTPAETRPERIAEFRDPDSTYKVLLVQLRLAEGFDLTPCTDAIFLGIDWTPAMMDQAEDRLHRIGTTGQVTCYYPLMRKTIDERLYRVVMEKREDARRVLGDVQVMREEVAV